MSEVRSYINSFSESSFSVKNRFKRALWNLIYTLLVKYSPRPFHRWRSFWISLFGAKLGEGVHIYPKAKIWAPWNLEMDDFSCLANGVVCYSMDKIIIGKYSIISQESYLSTGSHDYTKKNHPLVTSPLIIGDRVWITTRCFIHPGISIGDGAVIGACSIVTKNMPEWMVCAGNPCKPIKKRELKEN